MPLFIKAIDPELQVLGATQQFIFNQSLSSIQFDNTFVPIGNVTNLPAINNFETRNHTYSGYRWVHKSTSTSTIGSLTLQSFVNAQPTGTNLFSLNEDNTCTFSIPVLVPTPTNPANAANKQYVDSFILPPSRITGYPNDAGYILRGDGTWANNFSFTTNVLVYELTINNTNSAATATGLVTLNNGNLSSAFGFNNSTSEAYVWSYGTSTLKFGTAGVKRIDIANNSGKTSFYDTSYNCYIRPASNHLDMRGLDVYNSVISTIIETNANAETSSIVMNGDFMQFINPLDTLGFIFTDEDNASMTSYVSYINGSGTYVVSARDKKHSIRKKEHKDYLDRLNRLNIYSYGLKYEINESDSDKKRNRKQIKMNELQVGVIAEEVLELFDNATNRYKPLNEAKKTLPSHIPSLGINYNTLLCYTILAIQELTEKVKILEKKLGKL